MKTTVQLAAFFFLAALTLHGCSNKATEKWLLAWEDNFQAGELNKKFWQKVPRGTADWNNYMTDDEACYDFRDGKLILRGLVNSTLETDTAAYLTGGVYGKDLKSFTDGRIEICAKVDEATGAWPAIWMLPQGVQWPLGGEIDIMEHLNYDKIVYQTIHTPYTLDLGIKDNPKSGTTHALKNNDFNVYAVEFYKDSLSFYVNDVHTLTYPRIETTEKGQFPFFDTPFYLLLSMQLGGSWVGGVNPTELPVEMAIDWVRFYQRNPNYKQ